MKRTRWTRNTWKTRAGVASFVLLFVSLISSCGGEIHLVSAGGANGGLGDAAGGTTASDDASRSDAASSGSGECATDQECTAQNGHCDVVSHLCVSCTTNEHCNRPGTDDNKKCDAVLHRCVECGVKGDCAPDKTCELTTRKCVATCPSGTNAECPEKSPICDTARGICVPCITNGSCTEGDRPLCDANGARCVECLEDSQCASKERKRCDLHTGRCVQCFVATDCKKEDHPTLCDLAKLECHD